MQSPQLLEAVTDLPDSQYVATQGGALYSPQDMPVVRRQDGRRDRTLLQLASKREDGPLTSKRTISQNKDYRPVI